MSAGRAILALVIAAAAALLGGFLWYAESVAAPPTPAVGPADAIVALTGGPERIGDALDLLANGRGRRLLITGVNRTTRAEELALQAPRYQALFDCCIDIDREAENTVGNAVETRRWVRQRGFRSLIVVTSSYHMPRALAELTHQLPDVAIVPYPVVTEHQRSEPWWSNPATARAIAFEYLKYLVVAVRTRIGPAAADDGA